MQIDEPILVTELDADWRQALNLAYRLWLAPACSLLHVPVDLNSEEKLESEIKSWLAFALQKLQELSILTKALNMGRNAVAQELFENRSAIQSRAVSSRVHNPVVKDRVANITAELGRRSSGYPQRAQQQADAK